MKTILVLGHKGMLGNAVIRYLTLEGYDVKTLSSRWGEENFESDIRSTSPQFIINCIGAIPQKKPRDEEYTSTNVNLPSFLETLGIPIVHPSTDCEFSGTIPAYEQYTKESVRNAEDVYGKSKAVISEKIEREFSNTKIIRTSIIGHEVATHVALLDWFLSAEGIVKGYADHYWNGITTLEWAKQCQELIENWEVFPVLNQYASGPNLSKYDVLMLAKKVYGKDIEIIPHLTGSPVNKCLTSDKKLISLEEQLKELKSFYLK